MEGMTNASSIIVDGKITIHLLLNSYGVTIFYRLCGLVVRIPGCSPGGPGFDFLSRSGSGSETRSTQPREDK
jgi:hypothetical protein